MTAASLSAPPPEDAAAAAAPSAGDRLRALAALPLSGIGQRGPRLVARLREPERTIDAAYQRLSGLPRPVIERSRSAEWLLDNHYVVQRTLRSLKEEFPLGFERKLRLVTDGPSRGLALAYLVARELVAIGQGRVDIESLTNAIGQVQAVRSLTIAELWALPALLRLGLLEQLAAAAGAIPGAVPVSGEQRQVEEDAGRVIANVVRSLRTLETADWKQFFEAVSSVDRILAQDPSSLYRQMDFETRDHYRKAIEEVAAGTTDGDEEAVAREAVALSGRHASGRRNHVGYFLAAPGRLELEALLRARPRWKERWRRRVRARPTLTYLGAIGALSAGGTAAMVFAFLQHVSPLIAAVLLLTAVVPLVSAAVTLVNALLTRLLPPRALPKLDFSRGIPPPWRTLVAVPALLSDDEEVDELLAALEIRFLANRDAELHVALLTDLLDAPTEQMPNDAALVQRAADGIAALNARYGDNEHGPFHLFHRARRWNQREGCWMGWERKRGKLAQLNQLILNGRAATAPSGDESFALHIGDAGFYPAVRFVIVLDADTDLPRDAARQMAGALAHPLNRAEFGGEPERVTAGYTILQPRVEISPLSAGASRFSALFSPGAGLDPYTRAVSDLYQDLFGESSFIGKGIYDVDDLERSLHDVVPENALLSHDLFEGLHGRTGMLSDCVLLEDFPSHYLAHTRRLERWVRGDWQLLPWLGRRVPAASGGTRRNCLPLIARWRILDNLRRSVLAPTLVVALLAVWFLVPTLALPWTIAAVCIPGIPALLDVWSRVWGFATRWLRKSAPEEPDPLRPALAFWLCEVAFLPHVAAVVCAAIARTAVRVYATHRNLLQWTTAAHTARALSNSDSAAPLWREMAAAPALAVVTAIALAAFHPQVLAVAAPLLLLWLGAPGLAHYLSRPPPSDAPALQHDDLVRLRILARRTWAFFETFVGPADQWLPPDHFQEDPRGAPARRTSPTNIGLLQVSVLGALDFGYRGVLATALQLKNTFDTLDRLERHRGHFLNWYGTADLVPLEPRYVSTVDSGNLAACLLTVKQGCLEQLNRPVVPSQLWGGYLDTLAVVRQLIESSIGKAHRAAFPALQLIDRIEEYVEQIQPTPTEWRIATARLLEQHVPTLDRHVMTLFGDEPARFDPLALSDLRGWLITLKEHLERMQREMDLLLPWLEAWRRVPASLRDAVPAELDSVWRELEALVCTVPSVVDLPVAVGRARAALSLLRSHFSPAPLRAESGASAMPSGDITSAGSAGEDRLPPEAPAQTTASLAQEPDAATWIARLETALTSAAQAADYLRARLEEGAARSEAFARAMDFGFLYDRPRHLFYIGYNVSAGRLDEHHYDLLASEARLTSFLAIAGNLVPEEHWIHLGRPIGQVAGTRALLSWSGTMFEYLMPALLLREGEQTLIGHSCAAAVREQIAYAKRHGIPWGISECGYYQFDVQQNYQYRAFGVPGLGFKRGLDEDLVVAPYASLLALPLMPREVVANLRHLSELGMIGRYGLYEAIDFTPNRRSAGDPPPIVRSFMAHHQGMVLAALNNFLNGDALIRRFHAEPMSKTAELLLYERLPRRAPVEQPQLERSRTTRPVRRISITPWSPPLDAPFPQAHVLSNGQLSVVTTDAGGGGSRWRGLALTRWSADTTLDDDGFRIYLQDQADGRFWTAFRDAAAAEPGSRRVLFAPHAVEYHARYGGLTVRQRVFVAPDADVEIRHLTLSGEGRRRSITVVGFGEVVLGDGAADQRHPAFSKLFVESEYLEEDRALVYHRRPRAPDERPQYLVHMLALPRAGARLLGYDSARAAFIGRGGTNAAPAALAERPCRLSRTTGATLDPAMILAATIELPPHRARELAFITAVADSREAALELARRYRSLGDLDWTYELAGHRAEEELLERGLEPAALPALTSLLSLLLYPHPALRAAPDLLARNTGGRSMLWRHALSGDLPILLVNVGHAAHTPLLPVLLRAHAFWHDRGIATDLVIVNQHASSYDAHVDDQILRAIADAGVQARIHRPGGGIFLLQADQLTEDERTALNSAARVVLDGAADNLADQLAGQFTPPAALPPLVVTSADIDPSPALTRPTDLLFDNGYGGFSADGEEYVIHLERGDNTPAPWVNVVANPRCGFVVSERGGGYTWVGNSGENRLTPWSNDPISDTPGECIYIRDEESGAVWSPTPGPAWGGAAYEVRHGVGYSVFAHRCRELVQQLRVFVPSDDPLKISELQITNTADRPRRVTVTYYVEWVLGTTRQTHQPAIVPAFDPESETLSATNPWNDDFGTHVAFVAAGKRLHGYTADRGEFLGRNGDRARPAALGRIGLANTVRPGADPCAALQVHIDLPPGATRTVHFMLGQDTTQAAALELVRRYRDPSTVAAAWEAMRSRWETLLAARVVQSPDRGLDLMLNRWLPYQTLSARCWGRTGFYQSSGAFGFRDQLQDVAALVPLAPELCRKHIVESAAHQFEEGDVLHWWHPSAGAGIRTRCSDDLLWLPFVTAHYVATTGDSAVLSANAPFLTSPALGAKELERYGRYAPGPRSDTVYDHCLRAIEKAGALGPHALPLIGSGDWNDGMNLVGARGRGESIWLGWFLYATLNAFAPICELMGQADRAEEMRSRAVSLAAAIERSGWDGGWYRRGYYDDGGPLGSASRDECRIDALAQSWAVLSGAADRRRARMAMQALREQLVRQRERLILLLAPPFDHSAQQPGYIKGYPPGVRENGGQYSHAAVWAIWAIAQLGDADGAAQLFSNLLPFNHASDGNAARRYAVEPYVLAGDVYAGAHVGRGGWSWYTGAAGWAYRFGWEMLLGVRQEREGWRIEPSLPSHWTRCTVTIRDAATTYEIDIAQRPRGESGETTVHMDGTLLAAGLIPRLGDGAVHKVDVVLRAAGRGAFDTPVPSPHRIDADTQRASGDR